LCSIAWGWADAGEPGHPLSHPERILRHRDLFSLKGTATITCAELLFMQAVCIHQVICPSVSIAVVELGQTF